MATFRLSVVAPDRTVVEEQVSSVIVPGTEGYLGIMSGHVPLMTALKTGLLEYKDSNGIEHLVAVSGGFLEVSGASVIVLADQAERATDIDLAHAEQQLEKARRALRGEDSTMTTDEATEEIERALNRIKAARRNGQTATRSAAAN